MSFEKKINSAKLIPKFPTSSLSFSMIRFAPDQVLGWLGGNMVNQVGAQAADEVGSAARNAFAARGAVTGASDKMTQAARHKAERKWQNSQTSSLLTAKKKKTNNSLEDDRIG